MLWSVAAFSSSAPHGSKRRVPPDERHQCGSGSVRFHSMTAVFDPPTEESTDLDTERWEVQTSVPVAVTAPPNVDFILTSHAEQAAGDFPIELSNPQELFDQLLDYARREMGLSSVSSGILFRNGVPVTGYVDNRSLQNETASQALRSLLSSFVVESRASSGWRSGRSSRNGLSSSRCQPSDRRRADGRRWARSPPRGLVPYSLGTRRC